LDSGIEIFASAVVVWQLRGVPEERERRALRIIGCAFLILAAYLLVASLRALIDGSDAGTSWAGTTWVALTVVAMTALGFAKRSVGRRLSNPVLVAESKVTLIDAGLAAAVLAGLLLDALFGLVWADAAAGLTITWFATREGIAAVSATVPRER
jgi:divalent metal cation (Fe/Co/Zn/Cd) transporter